MPILRAVPFLLVLLSLPHVAAATPLDKETCEKIRAEQATLTSAKESMAKGAEWGKANLSKEKLLEIQKYIQNEEQIAFRCVERKPVEAAAKAPRPKNKAKAKDSEAQAAENGEPGTKPQAAAKPRAKVVPVPPAKAGEESGDAAKPKATAAPKRTAARPKSNDAFVPGQSGDAAAPKQ